MVECFAYNEKVGGSNPLLFKYILSLYRLVVRTSPFHGDNMGSSPIRDINFKEKWLSGL